MPTPSLLQEAERWLRPVLEGQPSITLARSGCVDSLVTVAVRASVRSALISDEELQWKDRLRTVREAIDVFYMLVALDPALAISRIDRLRTNAPPQEPLAANVLVRGGAFQLKVTLCAQQLNTSVRLQYRLLQFFIDELGHERSTSPSFLSMRNRLECELEATRPAWRQQLAAHPIELRCTIGPVQQLNKRVDAAEEFFQNAVEFIAAAGALQAPDQASDHSAHFPLTIHQVILYLDPLPITPRIVIAAKRLETSPRGFLMCERVCVDPRNLQVSHDEITQFINALSWSHPEEGVEVDTGPYRAEVIDCDGDDQPHVCDAIICGIANATKVKVVNLSGLMELYEADVTRRGIFRSSINHLFSRATPIDIEVGMTSILSPLDGPRIKDECATWRSAHPNEKVRVKKLALSVKDSGNTFASAVIDILDDAEKIVVKNPDHRAPWHPARMIASAVSKFQSLRKLDITCAEIDSMDVFVQPHAPAFEVLRLSDLRLRDRASLMRFVRALADSTSRIACTLHTLDISAAVDTANAVLLTSEEGEAVSQALRVNRQLSTFQASAQNRRALGEAVYNRLCETDGQIVRAKSTQRSVAAERSRRLAFLSAVQNHPTEALGALDAESIQRVFAFAVLTTKRHVEIFLRCDDSDGEDSEDEF